MSRAREAAIHRELARLHAELAEELAADDGPANGAPPPPRRARKRRAVPLVKPTGRGKPTEMDMARADALLRRHGIRG